MKYSGPSDVEYLRYGMADSNIKLPGGEGGVKGDLSGGLGQRYRRGSMYVSNVA